MSPPCDAHTIHVYGESMLALEALSEVNVSVKIKRKNITIGPDNPTCETMFVRNAGLLDQMFEEMYDGGCMR